MCTPLVNKNEKCSFVTKTYWKAKIHFTTLCSAIPQNLCLYYDKNAAAFQPLMIETCILIKSYLILSYLIKGSLPIH